MDVWNIHRDLRDSFCSTSVCRIRNLNAEGNRTETLVAGPLCGPTLAPGYQSAHWHPHLRRKAQRRFNRRNDSEKKKGEKERGEKKRKERDRQGDRDTSLRPAPQHSTFSFTLPRTRLPGAFSPPSPRPLRRQSVLTEWRESACGRWASRARCTRLIACHGERTEIDTTDIYGVSRERL
jgi:hypothetical protein